MKGFFKRHPMDKEMHIEITEEEQPVLFRVHLPAVRRTRRTGAEQGVSCRRT